MLFSGFDTSKNKFVLLFAVTLAVVFVLSITFSPAVAMADENIVSISHTNGKYVLDWSSYTPSEDLDGYVVEVNGTKTYLDGYFYTHFDVTSLLATPNSYQITLYANSKGVLTPIGSVVEKVVATLSKVKNIHIAGIDLTWDAVKNAKGYHVFVNGIHVGFSKTNSLPIFKFFRMSGQYQIAVVPVGKNIYYLSPLPSFYTHNVKTKMSLDLPIFIFEYMGQIAISWQSLEGATFSYSIDGEEAITTTDTFIVLDVEYGEHEFELSGEDGRFVYDLGKVAFVVDDEGVHNV